MMPNFFHPLLWAASLAITRGSCEPEQLPELLRAYDNLRNTARAEAAKLLGEFEGEDHVAMLMMEHIKPPVPSVIVDGTDDCSPHWLQSGISGSSVDEDGRLSALAHHSTSSPLTVQIDETGRPWAPCPRVMLSETPYYGQKGAPKVTDDQPGIIQSGIRLHRARTALPSTTLGDLKQPVDLTRLGLDLHFNQEAHEKLQVCKDFFFSSSGSTRSSSDPACVVAHLDESSARIRALDTANLRALHPKLKTALLLASRLSFSKQKKEWTRRLLSSPTLRLAWHVVEAFSEMNVSMLETNVGEALNNIVLKDMRLLKPIEDLIQFATTCTTYEEYPEKSWQDSKRYPSPDSAEYKTYPIYDYLRRVGAEVSFPKNIPPAWQPRVYDGNRTKRRGRGERDATNFSGDWKKQVYNSWHNLWVLNLIIYDAGSMWQWSQHLNADIFFFRPWRVTRVGTLRLAEAGPLRYNDLSPRFRVEPCSRASDEDYAACPRHLTDLAFFDKVKAPKGRVTAQSHKPGAWQGVSMFGGNPGHCPLSQATVPCPPKIHPDKCGVDATYVRPVESPWLYRLEREASWVTWATDDTQSDYVDRIWAARGTVFPKLWLLNSMWEGAVDSEPWLAGKGKVHSGFLLLFQKGAKEMLNADIQDVRKKIEATGKRQVVLFTGHSQGGAVAQIAAWYYASRSRDLLQRGLLQIRCVTFGTPAWGDAVAYKEFMSAGVLTHDIATSVDPVTTLNGEPALGHGLQWTKPFHYRIMLEDLEKVVVASASPLEPDFFGQLWTRKELHAGNFLKHTFGALANVKNVDSVFLNPLLTHILSYTAVLTIMADLVPEADFGSALAAPLINDPLITYAAHPVSTALIAAQTRMRWVMRQIALETAIAPKPSGGAL